ncbi:MAG: cysteine--tRNA ligase [Dehalococcoidales bacterium]|jgi:cysteinyl-tRNA synthetase|nr:cysteine--tRNA ligase [Dehalococcoidales bacterium]NLT28496.1 cysteine--tRNA ligase [Dehalococcoidales bacterium]
MKIYSTLSGKKEQFVPQSDQVTMYVCGVTPYSDAHIGHAMSYIIFDVIRRYIKFSGYKLKFIQNVTDVDDKIIDRANKKGIPAVELAEQYSESFMADMDALNVVRADFYPRATGEIDKIIEMVQGLIDKGYAYEANGSVYFRVSKVPDYGKLAHRTLDSMMAGARIEIEQDKEHPMDFTLWKASKPGEPSWTSPWGEGRPGWHIECSAMSVKYLGDTIDIHGGGSDLIFPHHENEIVQSECFTGKKPFAKYWMHNGLLQFGGDKMSKSLGNLITIKNALQKYSVDTIRIFILNSHYRSPLKYSLEAFQAAESAAERLRRTVEREDNAGNADKLDPEPYRKLFIEAMDDDFNTPQALAALFDLARAINQEADSGANITEAKKVLLELAQDVLGLKLASLSYDENPEIQKLIQERQTFRKEKNWEKADAVREKLAELGVAVEDTPTGVKITPLKKR